MDCGFYFCSSFTGVSGVGELQFLRHDVVIIPLQRIQFYDFHVGDIQIDRRFQFAFDASQLLYQLDILFVALISI